MDHISPSKQQRNIVYVSMYYLCPGPNTNIMTFNYNCCCSVTHMTFETFEFSVLRLAANHIKSDQCSRIFESRELFTQRQNDKSCFNRKVNG